jgi:hypothetical protein
MTTFEMRTTREELALRARSCVRCERAPSPRAGRAASPSGSAVTPADEPSSANCEPGRGTRSPRGA